jgi:glycosyltransferase involved in cell wall biosynthesis
MTKTLVVARFDEDQSWYDRIPSDWTLMEVQKGRELPNTGREASSFLWAILKLYPTLEDGDLVAFVQGDPFAHCQDIDLFLLLQRAEGFLPLGDYTYVCGGDGRPHDAGIPVAERYEEWLAAPWPGSVRFVPGAQFVVTGKSLKRYPPYFYQRLLDVMHEEHNPWIIERLWPTMFEREGENLATFYCQATPITTYLRCELPARYLPGKVARECVLAQTEDDFFFPQHEGAAVFQFAGDATWALTIHGLQAKDIRVLIESDDNYFATAPTMKRTGWVHKIGKGDHSLEGHRSILKWADGCIVTTEHLAKQYRKHNPNVYVAPNSVDPIDWPTPEKPDDGILRIGWFASNSHGDDAKLVERALEWASRQKDVEVVTMGMNPTWWKFRRKHIEWQDLPAYREALHELDVGVAPIKATPWALCRSDLKALEYSMGGAVPVLSDVAPYALWQDGENCLKAKDAKGFYHLIRHLVTNRDEAKNLASAAKRYVLAERTTQAQIGRWRDAISGASDVAKGGRAA